MTKGYKIFFVYLKFSDNSNCDRVPSNRNILKLRYDQREIGHQKAIYVGKRRCDFRNNVRNFVACEKEKHCEDETEVQQILNTITIQEYFKSMLIIWHVRLLDKINPNFTKIKRHKINRKNHVLNKYLTTKSNKH
jgi:hypothetical protein